MTANDATENSSSNTDINKQKRNASFLLLVIMSYPSSAILSFMRIIHQYLIVREK